MNANMKSMYANVTRGYVPSIREADLQTGSAQFVAWHSSFPGVIAQAESYAEATKIFHEMLSDVINIMKENGLPIPPPNGVMVQANVSRPTESIVIRDEVTPVIS
jgi:predicted RNase H-like HicB family nuclease